QRVTRPARRDRTQDRATTALVGSGTFTGERAGADRLPHRGAGVGSGRRPHRRSVPPHRGLPVPAPHAPTGSVHPLRRLPLTAPFQGPDTGPAGTTRPRGPELSQAGGTPDGEPPREVVLDS